MKKFICLCLCLFICMFSFVLSFASNLTPFIVPVGTGDSPNGFIVDRGTSKLYLSSNVSPVYVVYAVVDGVNTCLTFSDLPSSQLYIYSDFTSSTTTYNLNSFYNGYYFATNNTSGVPSSYFMDGYFSSVSDLIDYIDSSVFSTTFDLTYIVNGSVSWLSSMAQAVKTNGLLLFFVLFIFVGVGIGLFKRFTN